MHSALRVRQLVQGTGILVKRPLLWKISSISTLLQQWKDPFCVMSCTLQKPPAMLMTPQDPSPAALQSR